MRMKNLGINGALLWWRPPKRGGAHLPAEHFVPAIRTGLRYARHTSYLRATLLPRYMANFPGRDARRPYSDTSRAPFPERAVD